jgi:hypothetical protein
MMWRHIDASPANCSSMTESCHLTWRDWRSSQLMSRIHQLHQSRRRDWCKLKPACCLSFFSLPSLFLSSPSLTWWVIRRRRRPSSSRRSSSKLVSNVIPDFKAKPNAHSMRTQKSSLHTYHLKNGYRITNISI